MYMSLSFSDFMILLCITNIYFDLFTLYTGNYPEVDMIGGIFHIWFGAFIGKQTMKTRAVSVYAIFQCFLVNIYVYCVG